MFFSTYVLTKKGPLAKIWLAAHWDRRLTRNEVRVVDLRQSVVDIVQPAVPIALRTSGELLVGVVRIYALKVKHLLKDATDATLVLRVTTLPTKSLSSPSSMKEIGGGSSSSKSKSSHNNEQEAAARVLLDGVLLSSNGDIEAVTFNWSDAAEAAAAGVVTGKTDAEALEARFDDIADLLHGSRQLKSSSSGSGDDAAALLASAWYAVEPASQAVEELHSTQQDYDEIARMRADLVAFGDRVSGSSSSKKSSNPSIEKARSSGAVMGTATSATAALGEFATGFPVPGDELDIGVPLPDDHALLPDFMMPLQANGEDPFALPEVLQEQPQQQQQQRKGRPLNALDLAATTVPGEMVQRWMDDRSDIVDVAPRRGPYDAQECRDRATTLAPQESGKGDAWAVVDAAPLAWVVNPALQALYTSALQPQVEAAAALPQRKQQQQQQDIPAGGMDEDMFMARAGVDDDAMNAAQHGRKRGRDDNDNDDDSGSGRSGGFSISAMTTLKRIRDTLVAQQQSPPPPPKRSRKEVVVRDRCTLQEVCHGMHRREAARAFVNVLALASKRVVSVQQPSLAGDVELGLLDVAESLLAAA